MKELDFLPDWYRRNRRHQSHMRKQYLALLIASLAMMGFNVTATHRAHQAAAELTSHEVECARAEAVVSEFNLVTKELNDLRGKADLIARMDPKVDVAAVLAELSHLIGESVVMRRVDLVAEPFRRSPAGPETTGSVVRIAGTSENAGKPTWLGSTRCRVVLAGVAARPADVADLVCRLDQSSYFRQVSPSFSRGVKIQPGAPVAQENKTAPKAPETVEATEFEIICYLANYEETGK